MRMPVLPLAAAFVLSGFSAWEALRDTQLLQLLSITTISRSSLVAHAKIPTLLETVSIRAGKTFLDPPTTDTEFYLAVIDACFEPAVSSFDEHVAHVEFTARRRKFAAAVAAAAAAGVGGSEDSAANSTRTAAAGHESLTALSRRSLPEGEEPPVARDGAELLARSGFAQRAEQAPISQQQKHAPAVTPTISIGEGGDTAYRKSSASGFTAHPAPEFSSLSQANDEPISPHLPAVVHARDGESFQKTTRSDTWAVAGKVGAAYDAKEAMPAAAAIAERKYPALYGLVEAHYKPSTQVLRLRIQTQGSRRITAIHLHGRSRAPQNGRRTVLDNEVGGAGLQKLARLRPRAVISSGQSPVDEQVNQGEFNKENARQSASRSPATDDTRRDPPTVEIMRAIPSASENDHPNGDQNSEGDAESSSIHENNVTSLDPPWSRHLIDRPTVRDAFWREVKLTNVEVMDLFRGRLYVDIHTTKRQHATAQGFLACAQAGRRCRSPQAIAGSGAAEELELGPAAFRPVSCDPDNRLPSWLRKYSRNRLR